MKFGVIGAIAMASLPLCQGQVISTYAGTGTCCVDVDGPALSAYLQGADGLVMDPAGNLYIWETQPGRVRKVSPSGVISTVAGNGTPGYGGDGGPATSAGLQGSTTHAGLALDSAGNLYISDAYNQRIRKVSTSGVISTVAGNGNIGFSGDGGPATSAMLNYPSGIAIDSADNLYIADQSNIRIRKVTPAGIITTVAGNGNVVPAGNGGPATSASFGEPTTVAVDSARNLFISDGKRIYKVTPAGVFSYYAGTGTLGFSGDGGPAASAQIRGSTGLVVDRAGALYIADTSNQRVRKIDAAGIISTVAGATLGFGGDGGPAASALLAVPHDVVLDAAGNLYVSDNGNHRIRKIAASGPVLITNPATLTFSSVVGAGGPAPQTISVSSSGAALSFTAAASTASGGNWLSVTPRSGTTPATLSIAIDPTGLPGGAYQGAVTITPAGSASLAFAVTLNVSGAGSPVFTSSGIVNATGYQNKLAPDTIFAIFGVNLGPATFTAADGPNFPVALAGTSVTFTGPDGTTIPAKMIYTSSGQIAGLLPSSIAPGTYAVRVTYNTLTSTPQNISVVARSFGIITANSGGTGTAQANDAGINGGISFVRFTNGTLGYKGLQWTLSPAYPGDVLTLWGTGGGADPANDNGGTSGDQTAAGNFVVLLGDRQITPDYAGAAPGFAGLWQINFRIPSDMPPGCFTSLVVTAGGESSNAVTLPIAATGDAICYAPELSPDVLKNLDLGGHITLGGFSVSKMTSTTTIIPAAGGPSAITVASQEQLSGGIGAYTADEYAALKRGVKIDACLITDRTAPSTAKNPAAPDGYLDVGITLPVAGPNLPANTAVPIAVAGPIYGQVLTNGTLVAGVYTWNAKGGKDVGAFTASSNFPSVFTVTNWDTIALIDRSQPLTLHWTGGDQQVSILIGTSRVVGKDAANTNIIHNVALTCQVPAAPGAYAIPAAALGYLLTEGIDATSLATGSGILSVSAFNSQPFTAPLTAGGHTDITTVNGQLGVSKNLIVQ